MLIQSISMSFLDLSCQLRRGGFTISSFPVLTDLLGTTSLDESRAPNLWLFMGLQFAEKLIQSAFALLCQVLFEKICDMQ